MFLCVWVSVSIHLFLCVWVCACVGVRVCVCVLLSIIIAAPPTHFGRTMGRMHYDSESLKISMLATCSSTHSFAHTPHSLASLARRCVRSLTRSLTHSLPSSWNIFVQFSTCPESLCIKVKVQRSWVRALLMAKPDTRLKVLPKTSFRKGVKEWTDGPSFRGAS